MLNSYYTPLCNVVLPYAARQRYMHSFNLADPVMEPGFEDYLEIVKMLCESAGANSGIAYMTVDEKIVPAGMSQRKPKPHVDGCFIPSKMSWAHIGWAHYCNNIPISRMPVIVASSVVGCRAWRGLFDTLPALDGDLSHITDQLGEGESLSANTGYLLSPDCVHESMIFHETVQRSFLRIALPVEYGG